MSTRVKVIFWFTWVQCFHSSLLNVKHLMFFSVKFSFCLFIQLTQITRTGQSTWESKNILAVSFAPLVQQSRADGEKPDTVHLRKFPRLIKQTKKKNPPSFCVSLSLTHLETQSRQYFKFNAWCVESCSDIGFDIWSSPRGRFLDPVIPLLEIPRHFSLSRPRSFMLT